MPSRQRAVYQSTLYIPYVDSLRRRPFQVTQVNVHYVFLFHYFSFSLILWFSGNRIASTGQADYSELSRVG